MPAFGLGSGDFGVVNDEIEDANGFEGASAGPGVVVAAPLPPRIDDCPANGESDCPTKTDC